ncbi:MAG: hypothetical protein DMF84_04190 [Acidobacteria bacterium]|nr:MAG: hypothetical protein DMF84_04190 [Acidobacteriota bacterium]
MNSLATGDAAEPVPVGPRGRSVTTRIVRYTNAESAAVRAFNERMLAGRAPTDFVLPDRPNKYDAGVQDAAITWTKYLAVDEGDEVRGGFMLMEQRACLNGRSVAAANYQSPVSEGILDKRYGMVGMHMVRYVQRHWPYTFVVGMGAPDRPLPRLLAAGGWTLRTVPFLFRIVQPRRVLRELRPLQRRLLTRVAARLAAYSGAGWIGATLLHARGARAGHSSLRIERVTRWGEWADAVWNRTRDLYSFSIARDCTTLDCLYPLEDQRYAAYTFRDRDSVIGWAVCAQTAMHDHQYFGNLRVATVLDAVSLPDAAPSLASALSHALANWVDLIITNQSHALWISAFRQAGFASAHSNYLLAMSKPLIETIGDDIGRVHVTRGDGDGRIHLL